VERVGGEKQESETTADQNLTSWGMESTPQSDEKGSECSRTIRQNQETNIVNEYPVPDRWCGD